MRTLDHSRRRWCRLVIPSDDKQRTQQVQALMAEWAADFVVVSVQVTGPVLVLALTVEWAGVVFH